MRLICALILLAVAAPCLGARWGVSAEFADWAPSQSEYEAPVLAQRGVDCVFLSMHGQVRNWPNWVRVQQAWRSAKIACIWDVPVCVAECERVYGMLPGTLNVDDRAVSETGVRTYFGTQPRLGSFLSPTLALHTQRIAQTMAGRLEKPEGFRITANADLGDGSYDSDALASWRAFLKRFFADESPSGDTNGDTATFDSAFEKDWKTWDDVPQFTRAELTDQRKRRLVDLWLADAYAGFVQDMSIRLSPSVGGGPVGPGMGQADASLLASRRGVNRLFAERTEDLALADSVAATFGKRAFACPVMLVPGDLNASRQRALKALPYSDGAVLDYRGLAAKRSAPLNEEPTQPKPDEPEPGFDAEGNRTVTLPPNGPPAKVERFDPAFRVIPELAPFAGALRVERPNVLWVISSDREKKDLRCVMDAYCISEGTLALYPDSVDLSRFAAVIYASSSPSISTTILQRLFEYALSGGTVFIDAWRVADGPTINGRSNRQFWWELLKPAREAFGEGQTTVSYAGSEWTIAGTMPYLAPGSSVIREAGEVTDSTGKTYPLLLVRKMGKTGKWVFVNVPGAWEKQFGLLKAAVREEAGIGLPDPSTLRVYQGGNCALAIGGSQPGEAVVKCPSERVAAFDIFTHKAVTLRTEAGMARLPENVAPGEAKLWVVKPYGRPVVLYTDGTLDHKAATGDGELAGGTLAFTFAERAFVSSPTRPAALTIDGKAVPFDYDAGQHLVTITRTGGIAQARLDYAR